MVIGICPVAVFADQDIPIDDGILTPTNGDNLYIDDENDEDIINENIANENVINENIANENDVNDITDVNNVNITASKHGQIRVSAISNTSENWELNVPAELLPGESGMVTLSGMWPANKTMNITCGSNVVLTSNIDSNDTISVGITFSGLSLKGSNSASVSGTGNIAIANVDASTLFGSWNGNIKYYIGSEDIILPALTMAASDTWYKSTQARDTITSIKFVDSYTPIGNEDETWYADKDNGTVPETQITAYRTGTEIIVAGNGSGKIMANESCWKMFNGYKTLTSLDLSILDTSNVTDMSWMFGVCNKLTSLNLSNFDISNVTDMHNMFGGCSALTSLDLSNFNTSNVTNMREMFYNCYSLTSLGLSNFDTSKVTYMSHMFYNCSALTSLNVSNFNTYNVTDMHNMFEWCSKLISLNVSNFNTSNVTNMKGMFADCRTLTSLNVSNFDTSKVADMGFMFNGCKKLTSLNVSSFNTSNVTNMKQMFGDCNALTSLDISNFNTSKVTTMKWMFVNCKALTSLDLSSFNTSEVTDMSYMFGSCWVLTSIYIGSGWNTNVVTDSTGMFENSTKLPNFNSSVLDKTNAHAGSGGYLTLKV